MLFAKKSSSDQAICRGTRFFIRQYLLFCFHACGLHKVALWIGADTLVYGSKNLAQLAGVPEELIGFTLLAIGTSLPELAASTKLGSEKANFYAVREYCWIQPFQYCPYLVV